jgi:hypothetical protein
VAAPTLFIALGLLDGHRRVPVLLAALTYVPARSRVGGAGWHENRVVVEEDAVPGRELLERFRPAAAPGAVGRVGVPADVHEDAELLAVLAALGPTVAQAEALRERGRQHARSLSAETDRRVLAIRADATVDAVEAQAVAAAQAREVGRQAAERLVAESTARAGTLVADRERGLAGVVDLVLSVLRAQVASHGSARSGTPGSTASRGRP